MGVMGTKRGEAEVEMKLGRQKMKVRKELLAGQDDGEKSWHQGARAYKSSAWLGQKAEAGSHVEGSCRDGSFSHRYRISHPQNQVA